MKAIINCCVFTGTSLYPDHAVLIDECRIVDVVATDNIPADATIDANLEGGVLVPGYVDLQVNGGGGVLFNTAPTVEGIEEIARAHRRFGTTGFLPTLISTDFATMRKAIEAVEGAIRQGVPGVLGIHLEGPFLNPEKHGAHDARNFRLIDDEAFELMSSLAVGKTLVTIAPERTSPEVIHRLVSKGVIVAAGHTAASFDEMNTAMGAGVSGFTHLFNAMTPMASRSPGVVGAALYDDSSWCGVIADGYHVHPATLKVALAAKQKGGMLLVTDAMPTVGSSDTEFELNGELVSRVDGKLVNARGALAGSDLSMESAVKNVIQFAGLDWQEAVLMASAYPARAVGLQDDLGSIQPGMRANLVALDGQCNVTHTWIDGEAVAAGTEI